MKAGKDALVPGRNKCERGDPIAGNKPPIRKDFHELDFSWEMNRIF